jgi:hypothetical protein
MQANSEKTTSNIFRPPPTYLPTHYSRPSSHLIIRCINSTAVTASLNNQRVNWYVTGTYDFFGVNYYTTHLVKSLKSLSDVAQSEYSYMNTTFDPTWPRSAVEVMKVIMSLIKHVHTTAPGFNKSWPRLIVTQQIPARTEEFSITSDGDTCGCKLKRSEYTQWYV